MMTFNYSELILRRSYPYGTATLPTEDERNQLLIDLRGALTDGDWFTAKLMRLIFKSDRINKARLARVYPKEVYAVWIYEKGGIDES